VYRLQFDPGTPATAEVDLGNQYAVSAAPAPRALVARLRAAPSGRPADTIDFSRRLAGTALPRSTRVYAYPDLRGTPLVVSDEGAVIGEATAGRGSVLVCGLPAATFAKSPAADQMLRDLVRHMCDQKPALPYREHGHMGIRRGDYRVVKTFDGSAQVNEPTMDLMSPDLAVTPTRTIGPNDLAILKHLPRQTGAAPVIAASSACVEWQQTRGDELRLIVSGPAGVPGVMRLVTGGRTLEVTAQDAYGKERPVQVEAQGDTALLRFDSEPQGVGMRLRAR
jgi:hypothetical protein